MSLRKATDQANVAMEEFSACSQRVLREVDRFKRTKTEEMRSTVLAYIQLQVQYSKQMEQIWGALVPELEKVQLESGDQPSLPHQTIVPGGPEPSSINSPVPMQAPVPQFAADSNISLQYRE